jgi:hypothetical protein
VGDMADAVEIEIKLVGYIRDTFNEKKRAAF